MTKTLPLDVAVPEVLGRRWAMHVVAALAPGSARYSEIRERCSGVGNGTLTRRLRELERSGLLSRCWYDESPPRVEYTLTSRGRKLLPVLAAMRRI
jgi:DNA-binding HxlR family transcriptional regulator